MRYELKTYKQRVHNLYGLLGFHLSTIDIEETMIIINVSILVIRLKKLCGEKSPRCS